MNDLRAPDLANVGAAGATPFPITLHTSELCISAAKWVTTGGRKTGSAGWRRRAERIESPEA
jgi:hypothetical protein